MVIITRCDLNIVPGYETGKVPIDVKLYGDLYWYNPETLEWGNISNATVHLYVNEAYYDSYITGANGRFFPTVHIANPGTYKFYFVYEGSPEYPPCKSETVIGTYTGTHKLTVNSEPVTVDFVIDTETHTTPYSAELPQDTYTIIMPSEITINTTTYTFKSWEDGSTNPTRTINLTEDTTVTAYYELAPPPPPKHTLTVNSNPQGVTFDINGVKASTPWTAELEEGSYTITMPTEATVNTLKYTFKNWEDGSTNRARTINLTADTIITAYYELAPPVTYTLTVQVNNPNYGTTDNNFPPGTYTLPENAIVTVTAIPKQGYRFTNWTINDATSTENPITITIDKDYTLTANFEPTPPELATLTGKVTGALGLPLANAIITLNTYTTKTAKDGTYKFENIPPTTYLIKAEHWLYQPYMESVTLNPGANTLDIKLSIKTEYPAAALGAIIAILIAIIWRR
jgi:uncharacterized repeat protein (TIGR02543 family)